MMNGLLNGMGFIGAQNMMRYFIGNAVLQRHREQ